MKKDFDGWNSTKKNIEQKAQCVLYREQEVWWSSIGINVGFEQDGKNELFERPVLIFRKFNKEMFWALPMTSKNKEGKFYYSIMVNGIKRSIILSQLRLLSTKRLIRRVSKISDKEFERIEKAVVGVIKTDPLRGPQVPNGNL